MVPFLGPLCSKNLTRVTSVHSSILTLGHCSATHDSRQILCLFLLHCIHCMQGGLTTRKRCVCQTRNLCQNERNLCPHSYTTWKIIYPSFVTRMVGEQQPLYLKFWVRLTLLVQKRRFSVYIHS